MRDDPFDGKEAEYRADPTYQKFFEMLGEDEDPKTGESWTEADFLARVVPPAYAANRAQVNEGRLIVRPCGDHWHLTWNDILGVLGMNFSRCKFSSEANARQYAKNWGIVLADEGEYVN